VPLRLRDQLDEECKNKYECQKMKYSAATCDPQEFRWQKFSLRQREYTPPREIELFIVVTMYNEDEVLLARTLIGVFKNIKHMEGRHKDPAWGPGSWRKIVVCIVSDGVGPINKRSLAALAGLGVYQPGMHVEVVNGKATEAHIYEVCRQTAHLQHADHVQYTTQMELGIDGEYVDVRKGSVPVQLVFCLKQENKQKINSHRWFFQAFSECINPKYCVLLDAGTKPGKDSIFRLWRARTTPSPEPVARSRP
jgi:chitin synthase